MGKYEQLIQHGDIFKPMERVDIHEKLKPGVYSIVMLGPGQWAFQSINTATDNLVDIPGTAYDQVVKEIDHFLKPETRKQFEKYGFLYKRSALLYGSPGTGKTCTINRVMEKVIEEGGVVLFNPNASLVKDAFTALDMLQPETKVMVVFEELDEILRHQEQALLHLLDGQIQKNNVIYMATTNFIDKIPARIRRPGRFSSVIEVKFPTSEARKMYLKTKLEDEKEINNIVDITEGFSIDELKEVILSVKCLNYTLEWTVNKIRENKGLSAVNLNDPNNLDDLFDCEYDDIEESSNEVLKGLGSIVDKKPKFEK